MSAKLDFTPAPVAAPAVRRVLQHARTEVTLLGRNGEQLLLALAIPLLVLLVGSLMGGRFGELPVLAPTVLAIAVWSSGFTSVAISTGFERRYGLLERLASTPLGKTGLIVGKSVAVATVLIFQLLVIGLAAGYVGWRPEVTVASVVEAVLIVLLAAATFVCLALLIAGRLRAEATLGLANLLYVVLMVGGGLVIPVDRYPPPVQPLIEALPTAALGEGLRATLSGQLLGWPVLVLVLWLVAAAAAARKGFRWVS